MKYEVERTDKYVHWEDTSGKGSKVDCKNLDTYNGSKAWLF